MSLRTCPLCEMRAICTDSRATKRQVRRNYKCPIGHKYTTVEVLVDTGGAMDSGKIQRFLRQGQKEIEVVQKIRDLLSTLPHRQGGGEQ